MKQLYSLRSLVLTFSLFLSVNYLNAQVTTTGSGNWNSTTPNAPWPGGIVPTVDNAIIIASGHTVTVTEGVNQIGVITVNNGGTLICNASLGIRNQLNPGTIVNGTIDITVSNGLTKNPPSNNPTVSVSATGRIKFGTNGSTGITSWTLSSGSTVEYYGGAQFLSSNIPSGTHYSNLTLSGSGAKSLAVNTTVDGTLSMQGTATITLNSHSLNYGSNATLEYNTATPRTSSSTEWKTPFAATGGVVIANTGTITLNNAKVFNSSVPLTINSGATLNTSASTNSLTLGGNFINDGTLVANASPIVITGSMADQSIDGFSTTGLVSMTKSSGTATLTGNVNGAGLTINGSGGTLNLGAGLTHTFTGQWTRSAGTLNGGSSRLKLGSSYSGSSGVFTAGTGAVEYYANGTQTVAPLTYNNLTLSGTSAKTTTGVTVTGILSREGTASVSALPTYGASATLQYKGDGAQTTGSEFPATFQAGQLSGILIENAAGVTLNAAKDIGSRSLTIGSIVPGSSFKDGGFQLTATGTLHLNSGSYIVKSSSFPAFTSGTTIDIGTTVEYAATTTQTIKGITYSNLTIIGSGTNSKTADADITVNGILNLGSANASATQGCLEMSTHTLNMGPNATTTGTGDVTGIVTRNSFAVNTPYTFGNQFTTISMQAGGTLPTSISVRIFLTATHAWKANAINRYYDIAQTGGTSATIATLNLHYLSSELNGANEGNLTVFDYHVSGSPQDLDDHGRSNSSTSDKWVGLANQPITYIAPLTVFPSKYWTLGTSTLVNFTWIGATSDWTLGSNWVGGIVPGPGNDVIIPDATTTTNDPTLPSSTTIGTMTIQSGGILNGGTGTTLTINGGAGAWESLGTFNAGTSTIVFTSGAATMANPTSFYNVSVANAAILTLGTNNTMRIAGALTLTGSGKLDAASNHNTVEYNGAGAQTVVFPNGSTSGYHNLILSGSGAKTLPSSAMTIYGDFTTSGSAQATAGNDLTFAGNVTLGSGTTFDPSTFSHFVLGNWTNNGATFSPTDGSVTFNNATAPQSINGTATTQTFNNVQVDKAGQTLIVGGSTNNLNLYTIWIKASSTLDAGTGSTISITGSWWRNEGIFIPNNGTVAFTGSLAQEIRGTALTTFNNLTINKTTNGVTFTHDETVNGVLNLQSANASSTQGALHTGSYTLDMGASATTIGTGDVTGTVRRTTFVAGTTYTFGNQFTRVSFLIGGATLPTSLRFKISIGTEPAWLPTPTSHAIKREYEIVNTGGVNCNANITMHYLDSELNGNTESLLSKFRWQADPLAITDLGRSTYNTTDNWLENDNVPIGLLPTTFGTVKISMANSTNPTLTWNGSQSTSWTDLLNWTPASTPTESSSIIIPDVTNDPVIPSGGVMIQSLEIQAGGNLNSNSQPVTITGSSSVWINNGTFTAGTGTVTFNGSAATIGGTTNFYNLEISSGADLTNLSGSTVRIAGTVTNNGVWHTVSGTELSTVEYNGSNQTVVIPNPSTNRYSTLILSGTGIKTIPDQELSILGDFRLSGTASASATQDINITGNFTIAAGTSFTASSAALTVGRNWSNNGTFNSGTGTVIFNGVSAQTITGTSSFNNLTINSAGVTAVANQTVNGVLDLQSANASATKGSLDMGTNTLDMGASAVTTGFGEVSGIIRRTQTFATNTFYTFGNTNQGLLFPVVSGQTLPTSLTVRVTIGTAPDWGLNTPADVTRRIYEFEHEGGTGTKVLFRLNYRDSELARGVNESSLSIWSFYVPAEILADEGWSNFDIIAEYITISDINLANVPSGTLGNFQVAIAPTSSDFKTWNGSASTDWNASSNWTPNGVPNSSFGVLIPDAASTTFQPSLPASGSTQAACQYLIISSGGVLNAGTDATLTIVTGAISDAWACEQGGSFNAGSSTVIFNTGPGGFASISGSTSFNNVTITSGSNIRLSAASHVAIAGILDNQGTLDAVTNINTIEYNGAAQNISNPNGSSPGYSTLVLSGTGTKTMPGTALAVHGNLFVTGSAAAVIGSPLTVYGNVSLDETALLNLGSFSHTIAGNLTNTGATLTSSGSSLTFNGTSLQTITSSTGLTLNNLTITNTTTPVTSGASTNFTIGGNLTINSGSVFDLTSNLLTAVTGSISNSGTIRTASTSATPVPAGKTWGGTLDYYGDAAQTIPAGTYNNLTISGSGGATAAADLSVNGILNLSFGNPSSTKGSLDMSTFTLTLGASATDIGLGDVTGIISRGPINAGVTYTFGNPYTTAFFPNIGTLPSQLSAKITIGTAPSWKTGAIEREVQIIHIGGSGTKALFSCHYLDSELNGNNEANLVFWVKLGNFEYGRSANNSTENWVVLSNADLSFFSSDWTDETKIKNITLDENSSTTTLTWNGSISDSWTSIQNWTPNVGPSPGVSIIIPDALTTSYSPSLPSVTEIKALNINAGGILNSAASSVLIINGSAGAWINDRGTFNPNTSNVTFTGTEASISGTTHFYNVTIADGALLQNQAGSVMRITGSMTKTSTVIWDAAFFNNTVIYDADGAQTIVPNSYSNLTLRGSGIKTTAGVTVNGILSMEGTATASVAPTTYGSAAALQYNTPTSRTAGPEWITPFTATGGVIISNSGTITLGESKVLNASSPLTINLGSVLAVGAPYELIVNGSIINNAGPTGLVIQSGSGGDGKLINNSPDIGATVELFLTGGSSNFHFFVPPVSSMAIGTTLQNVKDNLGITHFNNDLMSYSGSAAGSNQNNGWQYYDGYTGTSFTYAPFSSLISSKGYNIYLTADDKITFKETLNNSPHTFSLDRTSTSLGWFLVGNPYPCNYDLTGVTSLMTPDNGLDKTIYFYHAGSYSYYNMTISAGTGGVTNIVPPMQGFFVRVNPSTIPMSFPAGSKTSIVAAPRSKKANLIELSPVEKIKLALSNSTESDETIVCLIDNATTGFDGDYDAYKLFGSNPAVPDIYTELGAIKYAINSVPGPGSGQERIPVVVAIKTPGTYKIDITEFENLDGVRVVLRHGAVETILSKNTSYSFSAAAGTFTDFELIIGGTATAVEKTATGNLKTWYINDFLYINCPSEIEAGTGNMVIYDIQGKPVYNNTQLYLTPGQTIQLPLKLSKGVYLTHLTLNNQIFVSKFIVL